MRVCFKKSAGWLLKWCNNRLETRKCSSDRDKTTIKTKKNNSLRLKWKEYRARTVLDAKMTAIVNLGAELGIDCWICGNRPVMWKLCPICTNRVLVLACDFSFKLSKMPSMICANLLLKSVINLPIFRTNSRLLPFNIPKTTLCRIVCKISSSRLIVSRMFIIRVELLWVQIYFQITWSTVKDSIKDRWVKTRVWGLLDG